MNGNVNKLFLEHIFVFWDGPYFPKSNLKFFLYQFQQWLWLFFCVFPCSFAIITTTVIVTRVGHRHFVRWRVQEAVWTVGLWSRTVRQQTPNNLNLSSNVICDKSCFTFVLLMFFVRVLSCAGRLYLVLALLTSFSLLALAILGVCWCRCKQKLLPTKGSTLPATQTCIT